MSKHIHNIRRSRRNPETARQHACAGRPAGPGRTARPAHPRRTLLSSLAIASVPAV
jgi:hypothetical protein